MSTPAKVTVTPVAFAENAADTLPHPSTRAEPDVDFPHQDLNAFMTLVYEATPMQLVELEREGVDAMFLAELSQRMGLPLARLHTIFRTPEASGRKTGKGTRIDGGAGQSAIGIIKLLGIAREIVDDSTMEDAKHFDAMRWLGTWIELPQPSLGGRKPADLLDTPTGLEIVARLLGALRSGAYQ
ncbi:MAG: MbcA/ParS/Xre antitoxin family protein [Pseudomonadota bacterium]